MHPTHTHPKVPLSIPGSTCEYWQSSQCLKHKRNVSTLILSLCAQRCSWYWHKEKSAPVRAPLQSSSFLHWEGDQTSEEDSSQVLGKQRLFSQKKLQGYWWTVASQILTSITPFRLQTMYNACCPIMLFVKPQRAESCTNTNYFWNI